MRSELASRHRPAQTTTETEKYVCGCGTLVLFYGDLQTRTCWKCQATVVRSSASMPNRKVFRADEAHVTKPPVPPLESQSNQVQSGTVHKPPLETQVQPGTVPTPPLQTQVRSLPSRSAEVPRQLCSCGTLVLFPSGLRMRTCWNCQAVVIRRPKLLEAELPQVQPLCLGAQPRAGEQAQQYVPVPPPTGTWSNSEMPQRSAQGQSRLERVSLVPVATKVVAQQEQQPHQQRRPTLEIQVPMSPDRQADPDSASQGSAVNPLMFCWCTISMLLNLVVLAVLFSAWSQLAGQTSLSDAGGAPIALLLDSDGDGILDHNDFCQNSLHDGVWISGSANDFDGDGCQDGVEDLDQDNDGIKDADDNCPRTPQTYKFVSDALNDFDKDGCKDGIEDSDDDGDEVRNSNDHCPRTPCGEMTDDRGCSLEQREEEQAWKVVARNSPEEARRWQARKKARHVEEMLHVGEGTAPEQSDWEKWREEWFGTLQSAWIEVLVGAVLSSLLGYVTPLMGSLQRKAANAARVLPGTPTASVKRISNAAIFVVEKQGFTAKGIIASVAFAMFYFTFFCVACLLFMRRRSTQR